MSRYTHSQYRQPFFLDAYSLLQRIENDKQVSLKDTEVPYNKRILLYDISLKSKNEDEDALYAKNKFFRMNVRIGQTVVQFLDNETARPYATFFGRKGMIKFFDLEQQFMMENLGKNIENINNYQPNPEIKEMIFQPIQQALYQNYPVEIYAMNKINGYNCQISYIVTKRAWIIACKNVSLLARDRDDVIKYTSDKYLKTRLVAEEWFNQLNRMQKKKINIQELQGYLEKHTLIGEYCGHQDYEQLIRYPKIQLNFYAIVNHLSHHTCLPPQQAFRIFESFYLRSVRMQKVGNIYKWNRLNEELLKLYDKIQNAGLEKYDEGCVLYIVKKIEGPNFEEKEEMLSVCKVKSLEYLIYAKLKDQLETIIQLQLILI